MKNRAQVDAKQLVPEAVVDALDVQDVLINVRDVISNAMDVLADAMDAHHVQDVLDVAEHVIQKYLDALERVHQVVVLAAEAVVDALDRALDAMDAHHAVEHAQDV